MAEALSGLHDRARTVHLDLKPDNILLTPSHEVRLTDFGISTRLPKRLSSFTVNKARAPPTANSNWPNNASFLAPLITHFTWR